MADQNPQYIYEKLASPRSPGLSPVRLGRGHRGLPRETQRLIIEDPDWPTPKNFMELWDTLKRMSPQAAAISALVALRAIADAISDNWRWAYEDIEDWVDGRGNLHRIEDSIVELHNARWRVPNVVPEEEYAEYPALAVLYHTALALLIAFPEARQRSLPVAELGFGVTIETMAGNAVLITHTLLLGRSFGQPYGGLLRPWWATVRQALPFFDAPQADISVSGRKQVFGRPWQIFDREPPPVVPIEDVPFQIIINQQPESYLKIITKPIWREVPLILKRIAAAIGLDMTTPILYEYADGLPTAVRALEKWANLLEWEPNLHQEPEERELRRGEAEIGLKQLKQNFEQTGFEKYSPPNLILWAFHDSIKYTRLDPTVDLILSIMALAQITNDPVIKCDLMGRFQAKTQQGVECRFQPDIDIETKRENLEYWLGLWWQEFKNAVAFKEFLYISY